MKYVVAVFDRAAQTYATPFHVPALGLAVRSFTDEVNRSAQDNPLNHHPQDFDLYHLCNFDDSAGVFTPHGPSPTLLVRGQDVLTRPVQSSLSLPLNPSS